MLTSLSEPETESPISGDADSRAGEAFFEALAKQFGTPFYAYDAAAITRRADELHDIFPVSASPRLLYSFKANPLPSVAREMRLNRCEADLTSSGEIAAAIEAGFDLSKALYGGPGKALSEFVIALEAGVRQFSIESKADLHALDEASRRAGEEVLALLRINPCEAPKAKLAMSGVASQFGFEEDVLRSSVGSSLLPDSSLVKIAGIHIYWGTQVAEPNDLLVSFSKTVEIAEELSDLLGFPLDIINFGGGFAWPYSHEGEGNDISSLKQSLQALFDESGAARKAQWWFESGRYLVSSSGCLVTKVMDLKTSKDEKQFLILDSGIHHLGGMAGLGRIPRFSIDLIVPESRRENEEIKVDVVGQLCTPLDCLGRRIKIPKVEVGDLLTIPNTGAYGATASVTNFLSRPSPVEIVYRDERVLSAYRLKTGHETVEL